MQRVGKVYVPPLCAASKVSRQWRDMVCAVLKWRPRSALLEDNEEDKTTLKRRRYYYLLL